MSTTVSTRSSASEPQGSAATPPRHGSDRVAVALARLIDAVNARRHGAQADEAEGVAA